RCLRIRKVLDHVEESEGGKRLVGQMQRLERCAHDRANPSASRISGRNGPRLDNDDVSSTVLELLRLKAIAASDIPNGFGGGESIEDEPDHLVSMPEPKARFLYPHHRVGARLRVRDLRALRRREDTVWVRRQLEPARWASKPGCIPRPGSPTDDA